MGMFSAQKLHDFVLYGVGLSLSHSLNGVMQLSLKA